MTISELADSTGIDRSVLGRWLSGIRTIRVRQVVLVMRELGLVVISERDFHGPTSNNGFHPRSGRP